MKVLENWEVHSGRITKLYTLPLKVSKAVKFFRWRVGLDAAWELQ
ncbi:unnamed protein product [Brassica napus]|uniref:(rape) hypothetical protein n=1 Tax=Brassica napus TaxID=3708 RepID=A0A816TSU3_BRANA|nr:unnamed protein product [Brassica napus]